MRITKSLLLGLALMTPLTAFASFAEPVSKQKNAELNRVAENQGNYDSPPAAKPTTFSMPGYDKCLTVLGSAYCKANGQWHRIER